MKPFPFVSFQSIRSVALVCICTFASYGCSGSSDSGPGDDQSVGESAENTITPGTATQPSTDAPEPSSPATTRVDFDIAYVSDELQVQLSWGDINTTAAWVRDESWAISETLPASTENLLMVTFSDQNGAVTLGTVEQNFRTGTGASEVIQITADQFDTDRWDSDSDGLSNIDELIAGTNPNGNDLVQPVQASLEILPIKTFRISWQPSANAEFFRVLENPDGISGFSPVSDDLAASAQFFDHRVALFSRVNARYVVQACNANGCVDSDPLVVTGSLDNAIGYFKSSNTDINDGFGRSVSLSADGNTLAVGAVFESSAATDINGDQTDNSFRGAGAVYVFVRSNGLWQQQTYLKASNTDPSDGFGRSVSLSADGNALIVGAPREGSAATGVNGEQSDNSAASSGVGYVFVRSNGLWQQQAYLKAIGRSVSLSADGNTLVVGAEMEDSAATGVNGDQTDNSAFDSGAVYVFVRSNGLWQQQAYLKSSNADARDSFGGIAVSLSSDGNTLAVGARFEDSAATGINGDQADNMALNSGAVYVFVRSNGIWQQQAYLKASNTGSQDLFGISISLSADGNTLTVGASGESSAATGVNGDQTSNSTLASGAVYVFVRSNELWQQQAYLKASNTEGPDQFGVSVSLSADGNTLAVGANRDGSAATGVNGNQTDNSAFDSGAVYAFLRNNGVWRQQAYIKTSNTGESDFMGGSVSLSANGNTLAVGASFEDSAAIGINGDETDNSVSNSGAVYLY